MDLLLQHTFSSITNLRWGKFKQKDQWTLLDLPPSKRKRKMVIFRISSSGDFHHKPRSNTLRVPLTKFHLCPAPTGDPLVRKTLGPVLDLGGCSPKGIGKAMEVQNQGTLSCTSFANETKHICMRYGTILSWIPSKIPG